MNRLREGYALTRNPMNRTQLHRIQLSPDIVDCIVFWSKDPANLMPHLEQIDAMGYRYYFQFTLTPYDRGIEKNLRDKADIIRTFEELSRRIGRDRVLWRYDPILLNGTISADYHREMFRRLCERLCRFTDSVTISFADPYRKLAPGLIRALTDDEIDGLGAMIGETAAAHGLEARTCCERVDLSRYGIRKAACIDKALIESICGGPTDLRRDRNQRPGCGCMESVDIGAYDTCISGCAYCYANRDPAVSADRFRRHDPSGSLLCGRAAEGETIRDRAVRSNRIG